MKYFFYIFRLCLKTDGESTVQFKLTLYHILYFTRFESIQIFRFNIRCTRVIEMFLLICTRTNMMLKTGFLLRNPHSGFRNESNRSDSKSPVNEDIHAVQVEGNFHWLILFNALICQPLNKTENKDKSF